MALFPCHECGQKISTESKICPQCGAKSRPPGSNRAKYLFGFLAILVLVTCMHESDKLKLQTENAKQEAAAREAAKSPAQRASEAAAKKKRDAQLTLVAAGIKSLRQGMKDPSAFDLTSAIVMPNGTGCVEYRGKNSFGAILPGSAVVTASGKVLVQERHGNTFVAAWNGSCTAAGGDDITAMVRQVVL